MDSMPDWPLDWPLPSFPFHRELELPPMSDPFGLGNTEPMESEQYKAPSGLLPPPTAPLPQSSSGPPCEGRSKDCEKFGMRKQHSQTNRNIAKRAKTERKRTPEKAVLGFDRMCGPCKRADKDARAAKKAGGKANKAESKAALRKCQPDTIMT
jgi:hypothetical protein